MHKIFTSYHTLGILASFLIVILILTKALKNRIGAAFSEFDFAKLVFLSFTITLLSAFYKFSYNSGMNQMTVLGFPRGFYQIISEPNGVSNASILYRYFMENLLLWLGLSIILKLFFNYVNFKK
jgi:hypothetical protein